MIKAQQKINSRRLLTLVGGSAVLLLGIAMIVLPGPAFIVIPAGLTILATEYRWAGTLLLHFRTLIRRVSAWARWPLAWRPGRRKAAAESRS